MKRYLVKLNMVKRAIFLKHSTDSPTFFFAETENVILKFTWNCQ